MKTEKSGTGIQKTSSFNIGKEADFNRISSNIKRGVYKCIGMGSGRLVFDMGNGYVVKAARNQRGIAQNEAEYKIASADDSGLFAKISDISDRFTFLLMEKAEMIRDISFVCNHFNVRNIYELLQTEKLQKISSRHSLLLVDFIRAANWGKINGKPVIIDYGFTREVREKYYTFPRFAARRR